MAFTLSDVVPWGRTFDEYVAMFALSPADLQLHILGCSDGPAEFNSKLSAQGGTIVSVDPLYAFSAEEIAQRIAVTSATVLEQARKNKDEFVWTTISSVEELGQIRQAAMRTFLQDFAQGKKSGRYLAGNLPELPFADKHFDLALCSHFLFLYSEQFSEEFHIRAIRELCRVAHETRIFPILELGARKSRHFEKITALLRQELYYTEVKRVSYEFQKGGNELFIVRAPHEMQEHRFGS